VWSKAVERDVEDRIRLTPAPEKPARIELFWAALLAGVKYAEGRKAVEI
jgi:hypothetical protein